MGRFYGTQHFGGKFGFAIQPSEDPAFFLMDDTGDFDEELNEITYFAPSGMKGEVKKVLSGVYDVLGVPEEKRLYTADSQDTIDKYMDDVIPPFAFKEWKNEKDGVKYAVPKEWRKKFGFKSECIAPLSKDVDLARCRIPLGIAILSEMEYGDVTLWAEC